MLAVCVRVTFEPPQSRQEAPLPFPVAPPSLTSRLSLTVSLACDWWVGWVTHSSHSSDRKWCCLLSMDPAAVSYFALMHFSFLHLSLWWQTNTFPWLYVIFHQPSHHKVTDWDQHSVTPVLMIKLILFFYFSISQFGRLGRCERSPLHLMVDLRWRDDPTPHPTTEKLTTEQRSPRRKRVLAGEAHC